MSSIFLTVVSKANAATSWIENFAHIGTFLGGVAAVAGVILGRKKINEYFENQEHKAAIGILTTLKNGIVDINEIIGQPALFESEGYYPGSYPERRNDNLTRYWERPNRLLYNIVHDATKRLNNFVLSIGEKKAALILNEINQFEKIGRELGGYLQCRTETGDPKAPQYAPNMQAQVYKSLKEYRDMLDKIYEKTASILKDIRSPKNNK